MDRHAYPTNWRKMHYSILLDKDSGICITSYKCWHTTRPARGLKGANPSYPPVFTTTVTLPIWAYATPYPILSSRMGLRGLVCSAHVGLFDPLDSMLVVRDRWAPLWYPPEPSRTFDAIPKILNFSGNPENDFPYMDLILWTIPDLLIMSWIPSETPNNIRSPSHIPYLLYNTEP
jgi:hypothetical protein